MSTVRTFVKKRRASLEISLSKKLVLPTQVRRAMYASQRGKATGKFAATWKVKYKKGEPTNVEGLEIVVD